MLGQGLGAVVLGGEEHEGVPGGAAVGLAHEEHAVLVVQDVAAVVAGLEELDLREEGGRGEVKLGQKSQENDK